MGTGSTGIRRFRLPPPNPLLSCPMGFRHLVERPDICVWVLDSTSQEDMSEASLGSSI